MSTSHAQAAGAERARDFEKFARHRTRAVGDVDDDGEDRGEDDGGDAGRRRIAEPQRKQRQHHDHRHGVEAVDVVADGCVRATGLRPISRPMTVPSDERDGEPFGDRQPACCRWRAGTPDRRCTRGIASSTVVGLAT